MLNNIKQKVFKKENFAIITNSVKEYRIFTDFLIKECYILIIEDRHPSTLNYNHFIIFKHVEKTERFYSVIYYDFDVLLNKEYYLNKYKQIDIKNFILQYKLKNIRKWKISNYKT